MIPSCGPISRPPAVSFHAGCMAGNRQRAATCSRVGVRSMPARPPNDRAAGGAGGTGRPAPCLFPLAPALRWARGAGCQEHMVDIGFGAIMGRQQLDRPRREIEDLKPDVDQRRADRGAQYIGQPRIGERRADKLMGAQYLESLALQERSEENTSELPSPMR